MTEYVEKTHSPWSGVYIYNTCIASFSVFNLDCIFLKVYQVLKLSQVDKTNIIKYPISSMKIVSEMWLCFTGTGPP